MKEENKKKTTIAKSKKVDVTTKKGGNYSYRYTELANINEYIDSIGETYYQFIERIDSNDYINTVRQKNGVDSSPIRGCRLVEATITSEYSNLAQEQGSALTYARRYSLLMAFGLATEDDDGASLTKPKATEKKAETKIESRATEKQIEMIKKLYNADDQKRALYIVKKTKLEDLTVMEASSLISQRKKEEK